MDSSSSKRNIPSNALWDHVYFSFLYFFCWRKQGLQIIKAVFLNVLIQVIFAVNNIFVFFIDRVVRGTYIAYQKHSGYCEVIRFSSKLLDPFCEGIEILQGIVFILGRRRNKISEVGQTDP